jgi:hypothetical protein
MAILELSENRKFIKISLFNLLIDSICVASVMLLATCKYAGCHGLISIDTY